MSPCSILLLGSQQLGVREAAQREYINTNPSCIPFYTMSVSKYFLNLFLTDLNYLFLKRIVFKKYTPLK